MATTTNYGWTTPNDTDLVKDGAAAIRTLGSSVDTTTKNLNPETTLGDLAFRSATSNVNTRLGIGTSGQVLTVAAGVPSWATPDDANAIQNAIVDAKGDLVAASAADTPARLAVGTNDQRLVAASGEATGLKYVSDTQNTVIDAEGDLLVGDAADTVQRLALGSNAQVLTVDTTVDGKIKWATPAASAFSGVRVKKSATQSIPNATDTVITFDTETFDEGSYHSTATNTGRLTVPVGKAGYYQIYFAIQFDVNGTGDREISIFLNGTATRICAANQAADSTLYPVINGGTTYYLAETDFVQLLAYQDRGGALDITNSSTISFGMNKVG